MGRTHFVIGIDVGNSFVKTVIAGWDQEFSAPWVFGVGVAESHGLRRGIVVNMDETIRDVAESVKKAEIMAGAKVRKAYVAVNGLHIKTQLSRGVIAVSRADNEIAQSDIDRVLDAASIVSLPANREILHIIPKNYLVDGQEYVKNPLGMKGVRLEAEVLIIDGLSPYIKNLARCLNANDIEVTEFIFSPRAASYAVLDKNQMEHGVLHLDLGGGVSTLAFFYEGEMVHAVTMPVGSRHITNDLAVALRTSMDIAEQVKLHYGFTGAGSVTAKARTANATAKKDELDLSEILGEEDFVIPRKNIGRVVEARVGEVFELLQQELKSIAHQGSIPAGIVLTGGGSKLPGLASFVKEKLKLPVRVGLGRELQSHFREGGERGGGGIHEQANDPALAVAMGLAFYGVEKELSKNSGGGGLDFQGLSRVFKNIFGRLKDFLP